MLDTFFIQIGETRFPPIQKTRNSFDAVHSYNLKLQKVIWDFTDLRRYGAISLLKVLIKKNLSAAWTKALKLLTKDG